VRELIRFLSQKLKAPLQNIESSRKDLLSRMAVITFYRNQKDMFDKVLDDERKNGLRIDTVDAFQVLLSTLWICLFLRLMVAVSYLFVAEFFVA
jgi:hypothetical protein